MRLLARSSTLTASVSTVGDVADGLIPLPPALGWQQMAWEHFRQLPEVGYPAAVTSSKLGRYRLGLANGMTGERQDIRDDTLGDLAKQILWWLTGETGDFTPMLARWGMIGPVVGEALILSTEDRVYGASTEIVDRSELTKERTRVGNSYRDVWHRQASTNGERVPLDPALTTVHRVWMPGKRSGDAYSPMAYLDKSCQLLEAMYGFLEGLMNSRLARNGLLFIPSSLTVTAPIPVPDGTMRGINSPVTRELIHTLITNIRERNSASGAVPLMLTGPDRAGEAIKWITMDANLADADMQLRNELREEIAGGLWLPQEFASGKGLGDSNHFSSWAVRETAKSDFYDPLVGTLGDALTKVWLRPLVSAMFASGQPVPNEVQFWRLVPDDSVVDGPADRSRAVLDLRDRYAVKDSTVRRESGLNTADAPDVDEYIRQLGVASANPYMSLYGLDIPPDFDWAAAGIMVGGAPGDPGAQYLPVGPGSPDPGNPNYSTAGQMDG